MEIKDRIKKISNFFKSMQITTTEDGTQVIYVVVEFPNGWIIAEDLEEKFGITVERGTNIKEYYFCTDIDSGEQRLFDAIDYNIDKMKEAIERAQLLAKKITELKSIFEDENMSIEKLRNLNFSYENTNISQIIIPQQKDEKKKKNNNNEEKKEIDD